MTIGIDASRANVEQRTGTEWYAYNLIQEFKRLMPSSYKVVLYTREPLMDDLKELPPNWESRVLQWPPRRLWTQLRLSWEMLVRPPDMLFVPVHVMPLILPRLAATTMHDLAFIPFPQAYGFFERIYQRFAIRLALAKADPIFTVSEFSRSEIAKYFFRTDPSSSVIPGSTRNPEKKQKNITVTSLGYDIAKFHPVPDRAEIARVLAKYRIAAPYFLFVGRLETKKNLSGLLRAFVMFKWKTGAVHKLVLAGKQGHGYDEEWDIARHVPEGDIASEKFGYKETMSLLADVIEPGYVETADMAAFYVGAEAFVFPSRYEGFGLPVLEAFACGTPVIASRITSIPEVGGSAVCYVDPEKPEEIAAAMEKLARDTSYRAALIAEGAKRLKFYSWHNTAAATWAGIEKKLRQ